ncbi:MAG: M20/M25/M40 family metallo-hydrolase [Leptospirales bacterium]
MYTPRSSLLFITILLTFSTFIFVACDEPGKQIGENNSSGNLEQEVTLHMNDKLRSHVHYLAEEIGPRSTAETLSKVATYIKNELKNHGIEPATQEYLVNGETYENIYLQIPGKNRKLPAIVIGAHYDSWKGTPGADDNASGVAVLLELAKKLNSQQMNRNIYLVFFTLEEPPNFRSDRMGSYKFAQMLKNKNIDLYFMASLEMLGYYSEKKIQTYPDKRMLKTYPAEGNFVAVVANPKSGNIAKTFFGAFKKNLTFDAQILIAPGRLQGVDASDHLSFWRSGYPAIMVTDTAFFRNKNYHRSGDTVDTLNYEKMGEVVNGLYGTLLELAETTTAK